MRRELEAAQRVRQMAVDDARVRLVAADRACEAGQQALDALASQAVELQEYERGVLASNNALDVATVSGSERYRAWLSREIGAAASAQRRLEQEQATARVDLQACLRANRAILRLIERRDNEECAQMARAAQNELDDLGVTRRISHGD